MARPCCSGATRACVRDEECGAVCRRRPRRGRAGSIGSTRWTQSSRTRLLRWVLSPALPARGACRPRRADRLTATHNAGGGTRGNRGALPPSRAVCRLFVHRGAGCCAQPGQERLLEPQVSCCPQAAGAGGVAALVRRVCVRARPARARPHMCVGPLGTVTG